MGSELKKEKQACVKGTELLLERVKKGLSANITRIHGVHDGSHRVITRFIRQQACSHAHICITYSVFSMK